MRDSVPSVRYSSVCNVLLYGESRSSLLIESTYSMIKCNFPYNVYIIMISTYSRLKKTVYKIILNYLQPLHDNLQIYKKLTSKHCSPQQK